MFLLDSMIIELAKGHRHDLIVRLHSFQMVCESDSGVCHQKPRQRTRRTHLPDAPMVAT